VVRFLLLAVVGFLLFLLVRSAVTSFLDGLRRPARAAARGGSRDELVKDPVCLTYVPRRSAVTRSTGSATYYFCSATCANKFNTA